MTAAFHPGHVVGNGRANKMCETWLAGKHCRFGSRCWYAHGPWELKNVDHKDHHIILPEMRLQPPTQAQMQWMKLSQQSEHYQALAHEAILMGNRFNHSGKTHRAAVVEQRVPPQQKQHRLTQQQMTASASTPMPIHRPKNVQITSLLDLLKDIEAPIRENSPMPFTVPAASLVGSPHDVDFHLPDGFRGFLNADNKEKKSNEICDIYSICGFCPLGDDCYMEHRAPAHP